MKQGDDHVLIWFTFEKGLNHVSAEILVDFIIIFFCIAFVFFSFCSTDAIERQETEMTLSLNSGQQLCCFMCYKVSYKSYNIINFKGQHTVSISIQIELLCVTE